MPREWDAAAYDSLPLPHEQWGQRTLARLDLLGDERVLDAGCGPGRDTAALLDVLPHGRVVALDASTQMLGQLRVRLAGRMTRVEVVQADLSQPLPIDGRLDAVFSVAAFHWIADHGSLFANLAAVLRPGGRLVSDCGGRGNVVNVNQAIAGVLGDQPEVWEFADVGETEQRLLGAGFTDIDVRLRPDPTRLERGDQLHNYLATVVLGGHLDRVPAKEREAFVRAVASRLAEPVIDYVRLEMTATRR